MLDRLILTYCVHQEAEGRSPNTIAWHRWSLGKFAAWLAETGEPENPANWNAPMLRSYLVALKHMTKKDGATLSPTAVNSYARSLRAFCHWLHAEDFIDRNPMERVKPPTAPKLVKPVLSSDELHRLLIVARESRRRLRDEAIILFMLDTGCRAGEVCGLRISDMQWEQRLAKVFGKGAKERYVPFSAATMKAVQRYMMRERRGDSDRLFESEEGRPLTTSGLLQLCRRLGEKAGVDLHPHKLRHTFAISYLRAGGNVFALQKTLGHTTLDMTLRYSALLTDDLVSAHNDHSPVAALVKGRLLGGANKRI